MDNDKHDGVAEKNSFIDIKGWASFQNTHVHSFLPVQEKDC